MVKARAKKPVKRRATVKPVRMSLTAPGPDTINPVDEIDTGEVVPDDPRVETLARRLCEVEGTPPDVWVTEQLTPHGPKGLKMVPNQEAVCRAWETYQREAVAAIEMFDAGELEKPA